jgi:hypothetical protein
MGTDPKTCQHPDEYVTDDLRCTLCGADIIKRLNEVNRQARQLEASKTAASISENMPATFNDFMHELALAYSKGFEPWDEDRTARANYIGKKFRR